MILRSKNPRIDERTPVTWLSGDYNSGTTLEVTSITGFANNDIILIGEPGDEKTEMGTINGTPSGTSIVLDAAPSFSHSKETPVYLIRVNQISWEYRTSSIGTATAVAGMPINIQWDKIFTEFSYTAGLSTYDYRFRFYNSQLLAYTSYSDWQAGTGFTRSSGGFMLRTVRTMTKDADNKRASDAQVFRWLSEAQDLIFGLHPHWWFWEKSGSFTTLDGIASYGITASISEDFLQLRSLRYRNNPTTADDSTYTLHYLPEVEFDEETQDNLSTEDDNINCYTIRSGNVTDALGYIVISPTPASTGKYLYYRAYTKPNILNSSGDVTKVPLPSILENYAIDKIREIAGEVKEVDILNNLISQVNILKRLNKRQVGQPLGIRFLGRRAMTRLFGGRVITASDKENYW